MKQITPIFKFRKTPLFAALLISVTAFAQSPSPYFTPGNLVVAVSGCGVVGSSCASVPNGSGTNGSYGDNQASPLTLFQYTPIGTTSATYVNALVLPQVASGANTTVSSEYGSSSEGDLQLSGGGQYLTVMGYGIPYTTFNANPAAYSNLTINPANTALAQSGSITSQSAYIPVSRVVALIDANGNVNSSTAIYNVFDGNNPRSAYTADGKNIYISGQGSSPDTTGGVFLTTVGTTNSTPTAITGLDTSKNTSAQDTRTVQVLNNTLYVSVDSKEGSNNARSFIGTLGTPPSQSLFSSGSGPTELSGFGNSGGTGKVSIGTGASSIGNNLNAGLAINLSPVNFFFANPATLYVADSGIPKNDSNNDNNTRGTHNIGDGGLQKWVNSKTDGSGTWSLKYTLYQGLNLVDNGGTSGTVGLYGLTGVVNGNSVNLYATNYTIADLDQRFLYGITDTLSNNTPPGTSLAFNVLATAPADSNFKGVSFVPTIPNGSVEITSSPSGLAFTSAGTGCAPGTYTTPITLAWTPSSSCTLSVATPQSGGTGTQYAFTQWEDTTTSTTHTVTAPSTTATYHATFATQYQLTTAGGIGGTVSTGGFYTSGTNATITATPSNGCVFNNFMGTSNSSVNPFVLTMTSPQSVTADFLCQPTITWPAPAATAFGSALSSEQLDATASVPGTFVYTPAPGTVLPAGNNQTLSVAFTPTDTTHYTTASGSTTITVNPPASSGPANLIVTRSMSRANGVITIVITVANTGGSEADNVVLTSAKVGSTVATPLPQSIGTIVAGASTQATVTVPGTVGTSGTASTLSVGGTWSGGTFSSTARITLP